MDAHAASIENPSPVKILSFTLSPNPAGSCIGLNVKSDKPASLLQILNTSGNVIIEKNILFRQQQLRVDISKLLPGNYIVTLSSGKEMVSKKFLKE